MSSSYQDPRAAASGMSRRGFFRAAGLASTAVAASGLLSGCVGSTPSTSGAGASASAADAGGDLTVWYWGEQEAPGMKKFMDATVSAYNTAGSDPAGPVKQVLQESDTLYTAFRTAAAAKKGPDVQFFWGGTQALEDVWMGNVAPLDDVLPKEVIEKIPADSRRETYWNGKQWGLPFYEINTAFAYNKKMFAKAGLDPEKPPATWDEFMAALAALKASGVTPFGAGFKDAYLGGWLVSYFGAQQFDSVEDALAPFRGDVAYEGDKYVGWLDRVKEMIDKKYFNDDVLSLDLYQGQQLFESGRAAITNSVQPQIVQFQRKLGEDTVGVMLSPTWGSGKLATFFPGASQVLTVTAFSQRKGRAGKFLQHLHSAEPMKAMYADSGAVTPDSGFDPAWLNSPIDKRMAELKSGLPSIWFQYYYPFPFERDGVTPGVQQLFQGGGSVGAGAKMMQDAIQKWRKAQGAQVDAYKKWEVLQ